MKLKNQGMKIRKIVESRKIIVEFFKLYPELFILAKNINPKCFKKHDFALKILNSIKDSPTSGGLRPLDPLH